MKHILFATLFCLSFITQNLQAQRLRDTSLRQLSRQDLAAHFSQKSKTQKAIGYSLLGGGFLLATVGTAVAFNDVWYDNYNEGLGVGLLLAGSGAMIASYPVLAGGARNKGKAEILFMDPGRRESGDLLKMYQRKATTNTIIAWSLVGAGFVLPLALQNNYSESASTISSIASLGIFASIPFFMEAAKNKGRVSILMGTEYVPSSYLNGSGRQTSVGLAFPL